MLTDSFGVYETTFYYKEPANSKSYEFRKYVNSKKIKALGGMYAIYCEEDNKIIFRKSEYLRDRSYKKFAEDQCEDFIYVNKATDEDNPSAYELLEQLNKRTKSKYYSLPSKIDKTKLTLEEFETLRKLIKKGLVTD